MSIAVCGLGGSVTALTAATIASRRTGSRLAPGNQASARRFARAATTSGESAVIVEGSTAALRPSGQAPGPRISPNRAPRFPAASSGCASSFVSVAGLHD